MRRMIFYMARSTGATVREAVAAGARYSSSFLRSSRANLRPWVFAGWRLVKGTIGEEAFEPFYFYAQAAIY
jgi:hypothetical protein